MKKFMGKNVLGLRKEKLIGPKSSWLIYMLNYTGAVFPMAFKEDSFSFILYILSNIIDLISSLTYRAIFSICAQSDGCRLLKSRG